jgi:hypothetical protein
MPAAFDIIGTSQSHQQEILFGNSRHGGCCVRAPGIASLRVPPEIRDEQSCDEQTRGRIEKIRSACFHLSIFSLP